MYKAFFKYLIVFTMYDKFICILMPVDQGYMKTVCWFHIHFILRHEFVDAELVCIIAILKAAQLTPLATVIAEYKPVNWMDRLVLISTVCITRDKAFIN